MSVLLCLRPLKLYICTIYTYEYIYINAYVSECLALFMSNVSCIAHRVQFLLIEKNIIINLLFI